MIESLRKLDDMQNTEKTINIYCPKLRLTLSSKNRNQALLITASEVPILVSDRKHDKNTFNHCYYYSVSRSLYG